ncbi:MAG: NrtA/SsuA/CpmA family ABC transporter substrate-binding protein [Candidatus Aenigmatarchaeota archaeon]
MKTIGIVVIVVIGILIGSYYFFVYGADVTEKPAELEKVTVTAYEGDVAVLVYIAKEKGYFEENGLDVTIKSYASGRLAADALLADEADVSTSGDFAFVSDSFANDDLRVFGTTSYFDLCEVVARKDRGISNPSDLKGKKIGVLKDGAPEFHLGTFLIFNGLSLEDVEIVYLSAAETVEAIIDGEIDATMIWNPYAYTIKNSLGDNAISWPGQNGQRMYFLLLCKEKWIKNNPDTVKRFTKALVETEEYAKANEKEVKEFTIHRFGYDADYFESIWKEIDISVEISQTMLVTLEGQARWRIVNNLTDKTEIPNYLDYFYTDALEEVKPESVTIIR